MDSIDIAKLREAYSLAPGNLPLIVLIVDALVKADRRTEAQEFLRSVKEDLFDEEVHVFYTLQWHRIIPHSSKVRGWTITPSHYLNNQLDTVWLGD